MPPVCLYGKLGVIATAFRDRGDDDLVLSDRGADVAEHADVHADVPLRLRLHRVIKR